MQVDPVTLQTKDADIFAGGDAVTGPATVVEAIAAGQQAAESIDRYIKGTDLYAGRETGHPVVEKVSTEGVAKAVRQPMPSLNAKTRVTHFNEVQLGYDAETSGVESERCLACGICCECHQCVEACLADAIDHSQAESSLDIKVGSVYRQKITLPLGPAWDVQLQEIIPNRKIKRSLSNGMFSGFEEVEIIPQDNSNKVVYSMHYRINGVTNKLFWKLGSKNSHNKNLEKVLHSLKLFLEKE